MGSGRSSPDSRCRWFIIVTAVRKSDRSLIGAFLPDLFSVRYPCFDISHIPHRIGGRSGPRKTDKTEIDVRATRCSVYELRSLHVEERFMSPWCTKSRSPLGSWLDLLQDSLHV